MVEMHQKNRALVGGVVLPLSNPGRLGGSCRDRCGMAHPTPGLVRQ